ncbi:MAG: response regulator transcription factor [Sulfitobacter sp.]|nr:response regulator transcription factor [Sulfitobacter sp.]
MGQQTILVVEDEARIRALLRNVLESEGFAVVEAASAVQMRKHIACGNIDLVTLDIHLGADNGLELAREIRQGGALPIIIVTGRDDVIDRVVGLELGADDYITKPFHVREVVARVRSVLRRVGNLGGETEAQAVAMPQGSSAAFFFDEMVAVPERLELRDRDGRECPLTSGDFKLLTVFLERPKRVLSRDQLMDLVGGNSWQPMDRTVDNQIARLRKKIEREPGQPKLIKTVRGVGYTFASDVERGQAPNPKSV